MKILHACLSTFLLWAASSSVVMVRSVSSDSTVIEDLSDSVKRFKPDRVLTEYDDDGFYQVKIKPSTDCTAATGTLVVRVIDPSTLLPVRGTPVEFYLTNQGKTEYTLDTKTNRNGVARYTFEAAAEDYGAPLWCSVSIQDPNVPEYRWQDIPCKMTVTACKI